jgi:SAM-dependent methyltransferase
VRLRSLVALISTELFGVPLALPEFPVLKSLRAIGMSDPPEFAARMAAKFDYTNSFYHQPPKLDITAPDASDLGRYDLVISSEVLEHVPPPVERGFANIARLLKPDGLLALTVPYRVDGATTEHYPDLHEYTLATPGGRTVLVNRRRDGGIEVFENLCFHGGDGSTLEIRVFSEPSLRELLTGAGFDSVRIACESFPEFGVEHTEAWSLPIAARKGRVRLPPAEMTVALRDAVRRVASLEEELAALRDKYVRDRAELEHDLVERLEWLRKVEADFDERTRWANNLSQENTELLAEFERSRAEAQQRIETLERDLAAARHTRDSLEARKWTRLGRKLGTIR